NRTMAGLLFLDIDRFKLVNDGYGHNVGDELLKAIAGRLQSSLREEDTVARLGGDEFTVILSDLAGGTDAGLTARRLLDALATPISLQGRDFHVTASIRIAAWPTDGIDARPLLRNADVATYGAKTRGGYGFVLASRHRSR